MLIDSLPFHFQICFDTIGKTNLLKKNLRQFSGFDFDNETDDYKKKLETVQKFELTKLKGVCEGLQLDKKGSKETISQRICEFLLAPTAIEDDEDDENSDEEEAEEEEEESEDEKTAKRKRGGRGGRNAREEKLSKSGRPCRSTAGRGKGKKGYFCCDSFNWSNVTFIAISLNGFIFFRILSLRSIILC